MSKNVLKFFHILKMGSPLPFGWYHPPQNHKNVGFILINSKKNPQFLIGSQEPSLLISWALDIYNQNQCKMFFVFTSLQICFSNLNLLWNCYIFCKWHFLSLAHLACNKFNVHGVACMKYLPSTRMQFG